MDQFQRIDPTSGQQVTVILYDPFVSDDHWHHYQEVSLQFVDGRAFRASFWRDPQERGRHWIEEPGMVMVYDLTKDWVLTAVDTILADGSVEAAFVEVGAES